MQSMVTSALPDQQHDVPCKMFVYGQESFIDEEQSGCLIFQQPLQRSQWRISHMA